MSDPASPIDLNSSSRTRAIVRGRVGSRSFIEWIEVGWNVGAGRPSDENMRRVCVASILIRKFLILSPSLVLTGYKLLKKLKPF